MKWFLEYQLGWKSPSNIKAEKGTIVHKVLELLGEIKLQQQLGNASFIDDVAGEILVDDYSVENLIDICADFYIGHSIHTWKPIDKKHCFKWTYKAIEYDDGEYDPRNSEMVKAEQAFDIVIDRPWAHYSYDMPDGSKLEGQLAIKGTIDQVTKVDEETYQILDWKTGRRLNWATGEEYNYETLQNNAQLLMYYYAAQHLYPEIEHIQLVIYYINDGGPYTLCFSREDLPRIEELLKKKFLEIKDNEVPELKKSWKCTKFCHYGKTTFDNTSVTPIIEKREGQITPVGSSMTKCEQTKFCLEKRPVELVIKHMSAPGHDLNKYDAPGEIKENKG